MRLRFFTAAAFLVILFATCSSYADSLYLYATPASAGMGGAFGSIANDNAAIIVNPAGISATKRYGTETGYLFTNPYSGSRLDFSAVDSTTSEVGAGFGYYHDIYKLASDYVQRNTYAMALSAGEPGVLSVGVTGRMDLLSGALSGQAESLGYGLIFSPGVSFLNLSIAGLNLTRIRGTRDQLPPRLIDTGISMILHGVLTIAFDAVKNLEVASKNSIDYHAGGELVFVQQIALRGGYAWETAENTKTFSGGIAWKAPRFTLAYTYVGDVMNQSNSTQLVSFTLYPF